jgi:hypothetical protein
MSRRMGQRAALGVVLLICAAGGTRADSLEKTVRGRWLGAWVVTTIDTWSECAAFPTKNTVNGTLVKGKGGRRFAAGEIAQIGKLDAGRSRIELRLTLAEPVLAPWQDGPFTLYREATCGAEMEIEVPRDLIKDKDADALDGTLARLFERHGTVEEARASAAWNSRAREAYPDDYDTTLFEHSVWKAEQTNGVVQARLDAVREETTRITDRIGTDPVYLAGFAEGVAAGRAAMLGGCDSLIGVQLAPQPAPVPGQPASNGTALTSARGRVDGGNLVIGLQLLRRLPGCFVPVPQPATSQALNR